jgi:polysaccharide deacetylase family protein (PEP-CTERM system associated)
MSENPSEPPTFAHALSVDVEDYFQVLNLAGHVDRADWDRLELRCGESTRRLLELFARRGARATFFFLGWIAERLPDLVREVADAGHEIGSHGYDHRVLGELGPDGFREDLRRTAAILRAITGREPRSFRACTWSIQAGTMWAPRILREEGYVLDSSIQPVRHPDYGVPGAPAEPYRILLGERAEIDEFPPLTWRVAGRRLPVGGGGYLRLLPVWMIERGLRQMERAGWPGCIYLHPWEVDPEQPRYRVGGLRGFRHYVNLERTAAKLDRLLQGFRFVGLEAALAQPAVRERARDRLALDGPVLGPR